MGNEQSKDSNKNVNKVPEEKKEDSEENSLIQRKRGKDSRVRFSHTHEDDPNDIINEIYNERRELSDFRDMLSVKEENLKLEDKKKKKKTPSLLKRYQKYREEALRLQGVKLDVDVMKICQDSILSGNINLMSSLNSMNEVSAQQILPYDDNLERRERKLYKTKSEMNSNVDKHDGTNNIQSQIIKKKEGSEFPLENRNVKIYENERELKINFEIIEANYSKDILEIKNYISFNKLEIFFEDNLDELISNCVLKLNIINHESQDSEYLIKNFKSKDLLGIILDEDRVFLLIHFSITKIGKYMKSQLYLVKIINLELQGLLLDHLNTVSMKTVLNNNLNFILNDMDSNKLKSNYKNKLNEETNYHFNLSLSEEIKRYKKEIKEIEIKVEEQEKIISNLEKKIEGEEKMKLEMQLKSEQQQKYKINLQKIIEQRNQLQKELDDKNSKVVKINKFTHLSIHRVKEMHLPRIREPLINSIMIDKFKIIEKNENCDKKLDSDNMIYLNDDFNNIPEQFLCIRCFKNERQILLFACGHLTYCQECLKPTINKSKRDGLLIKIKDAIKCPICRKSSNQLLISYNC